MLIVMPDGLCDGLSRERSRTKNLVLLCFVDVVCGCASRISTMNSFSVQLPVLSNDLYDVEDKDRSLGWV